tara:strand:+ start:318 stop:752 length:435 start_codon:yes stop_codon:yes gene_type:complete
MKITKTRLKQIIKEELDTTMSEGFFDEFTNKLKFNINPAENEKAKKILFKLAMRNKEKQLGLEIGYFTDKLFDMTNKELDALSMIEEAEDLLKALFNAAHRASPEDQRSDKELGQMIKRFLEYDPETMELMYPYVKKVRRKLGI